MRNLSASSDDRLGRTIAPVFLIGAIAVAISIVGVPFFYWTMCRFNVPTGYIAVLTRKTGKDIPNDAEMAPDSSYKGLQKEVLAEGRHFRNPWVWDWEVVPQIEIPQGKIGVRIRMFGDDPPGNEVIAWKETEKGIVPDVLRPGRYPLNAIVAGESRDRKNYAEIIQLHDPVTVPAGYKGVVTNLSGPLATDPNKTLTEKGKRGVEEVPLDAGTYYANPYVTRINLIDCRSQRFNLAADGDMGFPSKDGFWVTLDGVIEFRVKPEQAAQVLVVYNELENDVGPTSAQGDEGIFYKMNVQIDEEIIKKVVLPNARAFCRLRGSDHSGRDFISGEIRRQFQEDFQKSMEIACEDHGIEIVQALITKIYPPQQIATPVRQRQIAIEQRQQFGRELLQQESEKELSIEGEMNERKQAMVEAERKVVQMTTEAAQAKEIALIEAKKRLKVAELELQAATDLAAATVARGTADAKVVEFDNEAEAAGWRKAVQAFDGNGEEYARWVMYRKLAPAFRSMMVNTSDSPIMDIFRQYQRGAPVPAIPANVTTK
jgi:regulator of protease activity HflC (stomatin/prohibitin superfamily)